MLAYNILIKMYWTEKFFWAPSLDVETGIPASKSLSTRL